VIKKIALAVFALIVVGAAVLAIVIAFQPAEFRVERSAVIAAPASVVFAQVNDFNNWNAWSPWAKLDPDAKYTYEGEKSGKGAIFTWSGNKEVGKGRMEILDTVPDERIRIKLDFLEPMEATSTTEFAFKPADSQTRVTWTMTGQNNFMAKAVHLFVDIDKMVGGDFEKGLAAMKAIAEKSDSQ
jgi:hypothetical protein